MKFVFPLILTFFSFNSHTQQNIIQKIKWYFSQEELKEIIIRGSYTRESQEEIKKAEEEFRFRGALKEGESVKEKFANLQLGKERYERSGKQFCYDKREEEIKEEDTVFNPNLRVRLYDKEGNILSEDFLRDEFPENSSKNSPIQIVSATPRQMLS